MWKDEFRIHIEPEFLFETFFNSEYVTWLYVYLKLKNIYSLQKTPKKYYNIKIEEIISFFKVDPATIYRAIRELVRIGLLEKKPKSRAIYRIKDEKDINYFTDEPNVESVESVEYPKFLQIHGNAYMRLVKDLQDTSSSVPKLLRLYYFLVTTSKFTENAEKELESPESVYSIGKALRQDARTVKPLLETLVSTGYIKLNGRKIITIRKIYTTSTVSKTVAASIENECECEYENATHYYGNTYCSPKSKSNIPTYAENDDYDY